MNGPAARIEADRDAVAAHAPYVRALARELLFDRELARDLSQQVLLAALEHAPREEDSLRAWLRAVVRNLAAKALRSRARGAERERAAAREEASVPSPAEILAREDQRRRLIEHVLALEEPSRSTMVLRFFEGLPPREVARRLGVPVETVRTRTKRGLADLRARLDREHGGRRGAWCVALVAALKVEPPNLAAVAAGAFGALLPGVVLVGTTSKIAISALAVIALAAVAYWVEIRGEPARPDGDSEAAAPESLSRPYPDQHEPMPGEEDASRIALAPAAFPVSTRPDAPTTGSLKIEFRWHDGTPAVGVGARVQSRGFSDFHADAISTVSDDRGLCTVEDLPPGVAWILSDREEYERADIVAGATKNVVIVLARGIDLSGRVVERGGAPVADAEILLDQGGSGWRGWVVGRTAADGRFSIRSIASGSGWLSARAARRAPSPQRMFHAGAVDLEGIELVVDTGGGAIEGIVLDASGSPFAGARVLVGEEQSTSPVHFEDGGSGWVAAAQLASCDERGRFTVRGAPLGSVTVQVRGRCHTPWIGQVDVVDGRTARLEVRLERAVTVEGRVCDSSGAPVGGADVHGNGRLRFAASFAKSKDDGSYELRDFAAGGSPLLIEAEGYARLETRLEGVAGSTLVFDAVLDRGPTIRGRLVAAGLDFSRWTVVASTREVQPPTQVRPRPDGAFEISGCSDQPYRVEVKAPESYETVTERVDVRPGGPELEIAIQPDWDPTCFVRGRIVDDEGRPIPGATYSVSRAGAKSVQVRTPAPDGTFEVGPLPAGQYRLSARAPGFAASASDPVELSSGATWDFGDLRLVRGGTIAVRLERAAGLEDAEVLVFCERPDERGSTWMPVDGDTARSAIVAAGKYRVRLSSRSSERPIAQVSAVVEVAAGEEAGISLRVQLGRTVEIGFSPPQALPVTLKVFDSTGGVLWEQDVAKSTELTLSPAATRLSLERNGREPIVLRVAELLATHGSRWTIELGE